MFRTVLAGASALCLIAVSTQTSLAQPAPPATGNQPAAQAAEHGPPAADPGGPGPVRIGPPPPPHRPPPPPTAARFLFQRGRSKMVIVCPQGFALQSCVQAATQLMDKLASLRPNHWGGD